jgi:hypothetical protein
MTFDRDRWPPEADMDRTDLARWGILRVWEALHRPELRPGLLASWQRSSATFPAWNVHIWQERKAKRPRRRSRWAARPWTASYPAEWVAALSDGLDPLLAAARLSPAETEVMHEICAGHGTSAIARRRGCARQAVNTLRGRAVGKLGRLVLHDRLLTAEANSLRQTHSLGAMAKGRAIVPVLLP